MYMCCMYTHTYIYREEVPPALAEAENGYPQKQRGKLLLLGALATFQIRVPSVMLKALNVPGLNSLRSSKPASFQATRELAIGS